MRYPIASFALLLSSGAIFAQSAPKPATGSGWEGMMGIMPMMLIMFAVIYFLMIRPEQKKQKSRQKMMSELKKGDKILTIGGVIGIVGNVKDGTVMVKIAENTVVEVRKGAIAEVLVDKQQEKKENK
jgi:preprotein translocase subunit YajC